MENGSANIPLAASHVNIAQHNQSHSFLSFSSICDLLERNDFIIVILTVMRVWLYLGSVFWTASSWKLLLQTLQSARCRHDLLWEQTCAIIPKSQCSCWRRRRPASDRMEQLQHLSVYRYQSQNLRHQLDLLTMSPTESQRHQRPGLYETHHKLRKGLGEKYGRCSKRPTQCG